MRSPHEECAPQRGRLKHSAQNGHQAPCRSMIPGPFLVTQGERRGSTGSHARYERGTHPRNTAMRHTTHPAATTNQMEGHDD